MPKSQPNSLSFKIFKPLLVPHGSRALSKPKLYVRVKQDKFSMVIGKDIRFQDIPNLLETTLVGRFYGKTV